MGYFYDPDITLDEVQLAKMEMIGRKLDLKPGQGMHEDAKVFSWPGHPKRRLYKGYKGYEYIWML